MQRDSDPYITYWESEKKYRHGHRRSHSADSSNWPTEEETRVLDLVAHQQRLSGGEMNLPHPGSAQSNLDNHDHRQFYEEDLRLRHETTHGKTGHRQDMYLDVKVCSLHMTMSIYFNIHKHLSLVLSSFVYQYDLVFNAIREACSRATPGFQCLFVVTILFMDICSAAVW